MESLVSKQIKNAMLLAKFNVSKTQGDLLAFIGDLQSAVVGKIRKETKKLEVTE